ncbi:MAG: N-acetylmuramoyl-L-alanine amidase [Acidobacteriota bacterium]
MKACPWRFVFATILLLLPLTGKAQEAPPTDAPAAPATVAGLLAVRTETAPLTIALQPGGPLFALAPIAAKLGGELKPDPLGQSFVLVLRDTSIVLGANSPAATVGTEIIGLSQSTAQTPEAGLLVPLDLLQRTFGDIEGYEFEWRPAEMRLVAAPREQRDIQVTVDLVHLQGVSTLVLQFAQPPRVKVSPSASAIDVLLEGDRAQAPSPAPRIEDPLVKTVEVTPDRIHIDLVAGTANQNYTLRNPYRLVFDIFPQATARPTTATPASPLRRQPGIQTIVIDPGHGGTETGAISAKGTQEKELTLLLAQTLKSSLEAHLPVRVLLTRGEDALLPLTMRSALANQFKADLFISIHLNSSTGAGASGTETYFLSTKASDERAAQSAATENAGGENGTPAGAAGSEGDPLYDLQLILWDLAQSHHLSESQRFANLVQAELNQTLGLKDRGVKQAPFVVLMGAAMPAVLVELGFLSNPAEEAKLLQPAYRANLIAALVRAVERYRAPSDSPVESQPAPARGPAPAPASPPGKTHR